VTYDRTACGGRNVIERAFNGFKRWRGWPPDTTSTPSSTAAASSSAVLLWLADIGDPP
jgi:hypothetical protein